MTKIVFIEKHPKNIYGSRVGLVTVNTHIFFPYTLKYVLNLPIKHFRSIFMKITPLGHILKTKFSQFLPHFTKVP